MEETFAHAVFEFPASPRRIKGPGHFVVVSSSAALCTMTTSTSKVMHVRLGTAFWLCRDVRRRAGREATERERVTQKLVEGYTICNSAFCWRLFSGYVSFALSWKMQNNGSWLDPHWTAGRAKRNFQVNIGDGGDPCIPTGAVWSDTKSFTGSKEEVIAAVSRVALRNCSGCSPRN